MRMRRQRRPCAFLWVWAVLSIVFLTTSLLLTLDAGEMATTYYLKSRDAQLQQFLRYNMSYPSKPKHFRESEFLRAGRNMNASNFPKTITDDAQSQLIATPLLRKPDMDAAAMAQREEDIYGTEHNGKPSNATPELYATQHGQEVAITENASHMHRLPIRSIFAPVRNSNTILRGQISSTGRIPRRTDLKSTHSTAALASNATALAKAAAMLPMPDAVQFQWKRDLLTGHVKSVVSEQTLFRNVTVPRETPADRGRYDWNFLAVQNALVYGDIHGRRETKLQYLSRIRQSSKLWLSYVESYVQREAFSMLWLGCFDGPTPPLVPLVIASDHPGASIVVLHACHDDANMTVVAACREKLELSNVLIFPSTVEESPTLDVDDDVPIPWRAATRHTSEHELECDILVVSPGAVASLLSFVLPHEAEIALSSVLQWCQQSIVISDTLFDHPWRYATYWSTPLSLIESALGLVRKGQFEYTKRYNVTFSIATQDGQYILVTQTASTQTSHLSSRALNAPFRIAGLHTSFGITEEEGLRVFTNAILKGSLLSCVIMGKEVKLLFTSGSLLGCDIGSISARRDRLNAIIDGGHRSRAVHHDRGDRGPVSLVRSESQLASSLPTLQQAQHPAPYDPPKRRFPSKRGGSSLSIVGSDTAHGTRKDLSSDRDMDKTITIDRTELSAFTGREGASLARWWPYIRCLLRGRTQPFSAYVVGNDLGLVSLRLARKHKRSTVVCKRRTQFDALEKLAAITVANNLITAEESLCSRDYERNPSDFTYVFLSASKIVTYLQHDCSPTALEYEVGCTVSRASEAALLEIPRLRFLELGLRASEAPICASSLRDAYDGDESTFIRRALRAVDESRTVQVTLLSVSDDQFPEIDAHTRRRALPAEEPLLFKVAFLRSNVTNNDRREHETGSVSVESLLHAGLRPQWRSRILLAYLELPLWRLRASTNRDKNRIYAALSAAQVRYGPHPAQDSRITSPELTLMVPHLRELAVEERPRRNESISIALHAFLQETPAEHRNGHFSLFEWGGVHEPVALHVAQHFPNATVVSVVGDHDSVGLEVYNASLKAHGMNGNVVACAGVKVDSKMAINMYESPELARFSLLALEDQIPQISCAHSALLLASIDKGKRSSETKKIVGALTLSSLTTFVPLPSAAHVSVAMYALFGQSELPYEASSIRTHSDLTRFEASVVEKLMLRPSSAVGGASFTVRGSKLFSSLAIFPPPLARVDVVNLTRLVHHHYDWAQDGHKRTYTLRICANSTATNSASGRLRGSRLLDPYVRDQGGGVLRDSIDRRILELPRGHHVSTNHILHVSLIRDEDHFHIPYNKIQSVTLIAALRLGLVPAQRHHAFLSFVTLPLYEDMAPWNIAFTASHLEYIDFDTQNETYDKYVSKVYRVLTVLMNYKRTVEDLKMCGPKAKTLYGFSHVSDCVKPTTFRGDCTANSAYPVPCDDGNCHSDFISCLRAIASMHAGRWPRYSTQPQSTSN